MARWPSDQRQPAVTENDDIVVQYIRREIEQILVPEADTMSRVTHMYVIHMWHVHQAFGFPSALERHQCSLGLTIASARQPGVYRFERVDWHICVNKGARARREAVKV